MRRPHRTCVLAAVAAFALGGCLEIDQYPAWADGRFDGKPDNLPEQAYFSNDRLAWNAALMNRNELQSEYGRMDTP